MPIRVGRRVLWTVGAAGIGLVLYLSWIPNPRMAELDWLPSWLAGWADENGSLRTAVPFLLLGCFLGTGLAWRGKRPSTWGGVLLGLVVLVVTAEIGQLRIPGRVADWRDVVWGGAGAAVGMGMAWIGCRGVKRAIHRRQDEVKG